jgi:hypothetical protein
MSIQAVFTLSLSKDKISKYFWQGTEMSSDVQPRLAKEKKII